MRCLPLEVLRCARPKQRLRESHSEGGFPHKSLAHRRGALHTGALTTCAVRHKLPDCSGQTVVGATADGALFAAALLLDSQTAQALLAVQRALAIELEHAAGLNPIAFRCRSLT